MKRITFMHLRDCPIETDRLTALSIEKEVSDSTKSARMYIWECIYEGECDFPHFPELELTIELTNSFEFTHSEENDSLKNRRSPVSFRWEQKKIRDAENRALSAYLHQAKQEKRSKVSVETQTVMTMKTYQSTDRALQHGPLMLRDFIIQECEQNARRERPCYTELTYDVAMIFYLTSAKLYKLIRHVFPFPGLTSLYDMYGNALHAQKERLTNLGGIRQTLALIEGPLAALRNQSRPEEEFPFTLAIDAFSFQSFLAPVGSTQLNRGGDTNAGDLESGPKDEPSGQTVPVPQAVIQLRYGFIMMLIPHDNRIPSKILHLYPAPTGSYNKDIGLIAKQIMESCNSAGFRVWFKATDGDPGVSQEHDHFYQQHLFGKDNYFPDLIYQIHKWLSHEPNSYVPIGDPLHILKNIRAKMIAHPIQLYQGSPTTDINKLRDALGIGAALSDESHLGKMRDSYVTQLFTFRNVQILLRKGQYVPGFLILPFACWTTVIFCPVISLELRLFLVELAYHMIRHWMEQFPRLKTAGVAERVGDGNPVITFSDKHYAKRMLNTLAAFGVCLSLGSENLRMDSLGTHLVENAIGQARAVSNGDARYERVLTAYAHAELRKELSVKVGIRLHVPGRINDGGCKLDPDVERSSSPEKPLLTKPKDWNVADIIALAHAACSVDTGEGMKDDVDEFADELNDLASALDVRHYQISSVANSCIMARLIQFGSKSPNNK